MRSEHTKSFLASKISSRSSCSPGHSPGTHNCRPQLKQRQAHPTKAPPPPPKSTLTPGQWGNLSLRRVPATFISGALFFSLDLPLPCPALPCPTLPYPGCICTLASLHWASPPETRTLTCVSMHLSEASLLPASTLHEGMISTIGASD